MTGAARALNVTQFAVSAAIAALEVRHAIKLFHRVGRCITLTEAGHLFQVESRGVVARAAAAEAALDELGGLKRGTLRLVASYLRAAGDPGELPHAAPVARHQTGDRQYWPRRLPRP